MSISEIQSSILGSTWEKEHNRIGKMKEQNKCDQKM